MNQRQIPRRDFIRRGAAVLALAPGGRLLGSQQPSGPLRVAAFRCDVTTPLGQPIYSGYQPLTTVEHPLWAKGVVLEDGPNRYALCAVDWCELCSSTHELFRSKIARAAGTETSRVAVQTVHQHTAPMGDADAFKQADTVDNPPPHLKLEFFDEVTDRLAAAVKQAAARMEPFDQVGAGEAKVQRVASTRRVHTDDGKILVRWSSCRDPKLRAMPEGFIDPMVKTITLARAGQPLVRMHYYATHPQSFYGDPRASCDFPGLAREALEKKENVPQIYFTGCAGDITVGKYNDGSQQARDELTARLLAGMQASVAATKLEPAGPIQWRTAMLLMKPRTDPGFTETDYRAALRRADSPTASRLYEGAMPLAFLARNRRPIELSSLALGRVRIVHLPGEPMLEFQRYAQQQCRNEFVAVAGYGDCCCGYICTEAAFDEGGYEPTDSLVVPESEKLVKAAIRQLLGVDQNQPPRPRP